MPKGFLLKNNLTKDTLLKIMGFGLLTIAAVTSPHFLYQITKQYFKEKNKELVQKRIRKLKDLQKRKLIEFKELDDGSVKIILSHLGKKLVRQYKLEDMKLKRPIRWDKKWRIVIYDIPNLKRKASNIIREKLRNLGLYQLQKSVWISPYDCLSEIEFLCSVFEVDFNQCFCYFKSIEIPKEKEIKKIFNLL